MPIKTYQFLIYSLTLLVRGVISDMMSLGQICQILMNHYSRISLILKRDQKYFWSPVNDRCVIWISELHPRVFLSKYRVSENTSPQLLSGSLKLSFLRSKYQNLYKDFQNNFYNVKYTYLFFDMLEVKSLC